jgi:glycosyltransferase involved in cell wall biosynthesis
MNISIVIPTYNSEKIIGKLCKLVDECVDVTYELIIVNDSSVDNTLNTLHEIKVSNPALKIINLEQNIGQVGATLVGINQSVGEVVVTMDDDLQHHPKDIMKLVKLIDDSNYQIVIANWEQDETLSRNLGSLIFAIISSLLIFKSIKFRNTAFRAFSKSVKYEFISFFLSRFWLDPRRLGVKVSQLKVAHQGQNFRPYSSFKSRLILASKHLLIDTYLLQFLSLIILYNNLSIGTGVFVGISAVQKVIKKFVENRRLTALKKLKTY